MTTPTTDRRTARARRPRWAVALLAAATSLAGTPARSDAAPPSLPSLPSWLVPGARATWYQGSATIPTAGQLLVLDPSGKHWHDKQGRAYKVVDNPGTGGAGLQQQTVVAAGPEGVAVEVRSFVFADASLQRVTSTTYGGLVGTTKALVDYWVHPAELAARPEVREPNLFVGRTKYPLLGKVFDALVVQTQSEKSFQRWTYDLETGLLLVASASAVGKAGFTPNPDGRTSSVAEGSTTITSTVLSNLRRLSLPWREDARPGELPPPTTVTYRGTRSTMVPGAAAVGQDLVTALHFTGGGPRWSLLRQTTTLSTGWGGAPQSSATDRVVGAATTTPPWLSAGAVAGLRPGTVVDEDPVTKFRTTFVGIRGGFVGLLEEGPFDRAESWYDAHTGVLASASHTQTQGVGRVHVQVQRAPR